MIEWKIHEMIAYLLIMWNVSAHAAYKQGQLFCYIGFCCMHDLNVRMPFVSIIYVVFRLFRRACVRFRKMFCFLKPK